jgi:hypothetical protein
MVLSVIECPPPTTASSERIADAISSPDLSFDQSWAGSAKRSARLDLRMTSIGTYIIGGFNERSEHA